MTDVSLVQTAMSAIHVSKTLTTMPKVDATALKASLSCPRDTTSASTSLPAKMTFSSKSKKHS